VRGQPARPKAPPTAQTPTASLGSSAQQDDRDRLATPAPPAIRQAVPSNTQAAAPEPRPAASHAATMHSPRTEPEAPAAAKAGLARTPNTASQARVSTPP